MMGGLEEAGGGIVPVKDPGIGKKLKYAAAMMENNYPVYGEKIDRRPIKKGRSKKVRLKRLMVRKSKRMNRRKK